VLCGYAGLVCYLAAINVGPALAADASHDIRVNSSGDVTDTTHLTGWLVHPPGLLTAVVFLSLGVIWLSFVGHQVLSWRRASGERRQQLKWLACGAAAALGLSLLGNAVSWNVVSRLLEFGVVALPAGIGVGILKYRLYDIDRIISRTLAYGIVTGLLVGVYAGLVLLATQVLQIHTPVAVAASTLAAAALFNPVRRRVQNAVDRRFNRARYDADQMVTAFAARLKDTVDLDSVQDDLARVVTKTLEPVHISAAQPAPRSHPSPPMVVAPYGKVTVECHNHRKRTSAPARARDAGGALGTGNAQCARGQRPEAEPATR
jgi:hypothetical protein